MIDSVNKILDLSRMEAKMMDYHFRQCSLASVIQRGVLKVAPIALRKKIGLEINKTHPLISGYLREECQQVEIVDISEILADMRIIKTSEEIEIMRQADQVSVAMCQGGKGAIAEGVPEYEVALAVIAAGTRKAAEFLTDEGPDRLFSPMIYSLQVLQSG